MAFSIKNICTGVGTAGNPAFELIASVSLLWLAWSGVSGDFLYPNTTQSRLNAALK